MRLTGPGLGLAGSASLGLLVSSLAALREASVALGALIMHLH